MSCSEVTLGEISIGNKGSYGIAAAAVEYSEKLYTYLRITDINDDGTLNKDGLKSVDDKNAKKYLLKPNDIVFARTGGSTGKSYFYDGSDGEFVYAGFLIKFSLDPTKVNPKYLKYYTLSDEYKGWVNSFNTGSTRGNINAQTYSNMKLTLPDDDQQNLLVDTLSCLDDKIELNNRINKTLEKIAQAIFKSWFIDFEPFQDGEFEDSELGRIPKGWRVGTLGDILTLNYGKSLTAKNRINGEVRVYSSAGVTGFHNQALVNEPSIIVGRKGTIGTVYYSVEPSFCIDTAYYAVQKDSRFPLLLMYQLLKELKLDSYNEDSAVPGLNRNTVYAINIIIPPESILKQCSEKLTSIYSLIFNNLNQNHTLTAIRDILLPKLMSGEIRVPLEEVQ